MNQVNKPNTLLKDMSLAISIIAVMLAGFAIYKSITVNLNHNPQNQYLVVDTDLLTRAYLNQVISKLKDNKDNPVQLQEEVLNKLNNLQQQLHTISKQTGKILIRKSSVLSYPDYPDNNNIDITQKVAQELNININLAKEDPATAEKKDMAKEFQHLEQATDDVGSFLD